MAKTTFTDIDAEPVTSDEEAPKTETTALAPTQSTAVAAQDDSFFSNEGFEGFTDKKALEIPRIILVHAVGDLSANFEPGSVVLNGEKKLVLPLEIIPLRVSNFIREHIPYNDESRKDDIPKTWKTPEEARKDGFVFFWEKDREDKSTPVCENAANIDLLMKGYPEIADLCPVNIGDDFFMPVRMSVKGKQHKLVYNKLYTQASFNKGAPPCAFRWGLSTKRLKEGSNWVWRMHIDLKGRNTPEQIEQYRSILG